MSFVSLEAFDQERFLDLSSLDQRSPERLMMADSRKRKAWNSSVLDAQLEEYAFSINGHAYLNGIPNRKCYLVVNAEERT